jgi:acylphosphatase
MLQHFNIRIFGQVQDVGFRYSAKQKAHSLRLRGLVRNEPGGSVYLEIEGENEAVAEFLAWCKNGPAWAKVTKQELSEGEMKNYPDFVIV